MSTTRRDVILKKILSNFNILKNIFEYLCVNDQFMILHVCEPFRYVIVELIWKVKLRSVHIYQTPYVGVLVENCRIAAYDALAGPSHEAVRGLEAIKKRKVVLKTQYCRQLFKINSKNVRILKICSEYCDFGASFNNSDFFPVHFCENLVHLCYHKIIVGGNQLQLLAKHCRKLQRIELLECVCEDLKPLRPGYNLCLELLAQILRLEALVVQSDPSNGDGENDLPCHFLLELLQKLNLKCLQLRNLKIIGNANKNKKKGLHLKDLKILDVGCISDEFWPLFKILLKKTSSLDELSINVSNCNTKFSVEIMNILTNTSPGLKRLCIENCDLQIENFCALEKLQEISLSNCGGFTFANLQEIMGGLPLLRRFNLINTRMLGEISHIYVSPSLQHITIDTILFTTISEAFQKSLNKFENLHQLQWLNGDINNNWIIEKCPNLRMLNIPNPYLLRRVAFTMKSLQEFTFTSCDGLSWCIIWILIKNLTLRRLNVHTQDVISEIQGFPKSGKNTKTSLRSIVMPFGIFTAAQECWLDLMANNEQLHILFYGHHDELMQVNFVQGLLRHEHVSERVKSIRICGLTVDCQHLRLEFMKIMQLLNLATCHYRSRNVPFTIEL
ncbi:uncharacterized protein LOC105262298 isoform X1 [Musca domestica]|uniref:Uncharacterized protein LOC105262296 n=1 Tax=Musca domestica TaxID=7370 RepID=A0A1I8NJT5_MUSDO|nr:uncharacterized protein LOC105262298 isoform X1 [Musca domestica]